MMSETIFYYNKFKLTTFTSFRIVLLFSNIIMLLNFFQRYFTKYDNISYKKYHPSRTREGWLRIFSFCYARTFSR